MILVARRDAKEMKGETLGFGNMGQNPSSSSVPPITGSPWARGKGCLLFCLAALLLASCAGISQRDPVPSIPWEQFGPSFAALGGMSSNDILDPSSRIFALILSAEATSASEQEDLGLAVLARASALISLVEGDLRRAELYSALARAYLSLDAQESALTLLTRATDLVLSSLNAAAEPDARALPVLEDIIYALFALGPPGFDQLRRAAQRIYIVPDYGQRVILLTRIAAEYQARGSGQRASLLLQQAIAALDAIGNPALRALGYTAVAHRFQAQQDLAEAESFGSAGLSQVQNLDFGNLSSEELEWVQDAITNLIALDYAAESTNLISRLSSSEARQSLLLELVEHYLATDQAFAAELILQQALQLIDAAESRPSRVYGYLRIAEIYLAANDPWNAEYFLETLYFTGSLSSGVLDDFSLSEALALSVALNRMDMANLIFPEIREPLPALLALDRSLQRIPDTEGSRLDWILDKEMELLGLLGAQADQGLSRLAVGLNKAGRVEEAIEVLARISDPYTLSLTASEMAFQTPSPEGIEEELIAIIRRYE